MNCILKTCAHGVGGGHSRNPCCATFALELSKRNDGFLAVARDWPAIDELRDAGLVTIKYAGDGVVIVRAVHNPSTLQPLRRDTAERWARAAEMGPVRV